MESTKTVVSERAMRARVNRQLARGGRRLRKWRPRWQQCQGSKAYYVVDPFYNLIVDKCVGLDEIAQELCVLGGEEQIEQVDC